MTHPSATGGSDLRGVFVVGMHSGGTSAITGALIGLGLGGPADPPPPSDQHPHGICESPRMWQFNGDLLERLGSSAVVGMPGVPLLGDRWLDEPQIVDRYPEGAALLHDAFPNEPWAVKDPRLCVVLPFWRRIVDDAAAAVLVVRHPTEMVRSFEDWTEPERNEADRLLWWEHYMRSAVRDLAGLPVLVTEYGAALADPEGWCHIASDWLRTLGLVETADVGAGVAHLDPSVRKHDDPGVDALPATIARLLTGLRDASGTYARWDPSVVATQA